MNNQFQISSKEELRKLIRARKSELSSIEKEDEAKAVFSKIEELTEFNQANCIMLYYSLPDELPTESIINKWSQNKNLVLPRINGENLKIFKYEPSKIEIGTLGIIEPSSNCTEVQPDEIDIIITPGIAFDFHCNRLGRGRGYYDKLLTESSATKIGVAFDCQILNMIPIEQHDCSMNLVITKSHFITGK